MKKLPFREAAGFLESVVKDPHQEPVVLIHARKPVAVIYPVGNADYEIVSLSFSPKFAAIIQESRESMAREGSISEEEVRKQLGLLSYEESRKLRDGEATSARRRKTKKTTS